MAWLESHQTLAGHPKTRKLAHLLNIPKPQAIGHLHCFWWWALDYAQEGDLRRYDALDLAIGAEWEGDAEAFVDAMVLAGFIDDDDGWQIHDWHDYAGKLIARRKANAERMKAARAENETPTTPPDNDDVQCTNPERAKNVQRTQRARVERQNQTVPNQTKQNQDQPPHGADAPEEEPAHNCSELSGVQAVRFERWYQHWPRKKSRGAAERAWKRIKPAPTDALVDQMIAKTQAWAKSHDWTKDGGQFCPYPASWLNARGWEDDDPQSAPDNITQFQSKPRSGRGYSADDLLAMARGEPR